MRHLEQVSTAARLLMAPRHAHGTIAPMDALRTDRQLARRRNKRIMRLFYRMAFICWWCERVRVPAAPSPEAREALRAAMWTRIGALFRDAATDMGGLLIKVGQLLSARADLFPPDFTQALRSLQDEVPGLRSTPSAPTSKAPGRSLARCCSPPRKGAAGGMMGCPAPRPRRP